MPRSFPGSWMFSLLEAVAIVLYSVSVRFLRNSRLCNFHVDFEHIALIFFI